MRPKLESIIRVISMELESTLILVVGATGGSTNLNISKGSEQANIQMEHSNIVNIKTEENMGTELSLHLPKKYIVASSIITTRNLGMDSLSMKTTMSITGNGEATRDMEKESSRRRPLEELKEDSIKKINS